MNPGALYRLPVFDMFPYVVAAASLGIAQGAVAQFAEETKHRVTSYSTTLLSDHATTQARLGQAAAAVDTAEMLLIQRCQYAMAAAEEARVPSRAEKIRLRRDGAYAALLCTRAVDRLFEAGGGEFLYDQKVMQRAFRDIHAAQGHYALAWDVHCVDRRQVHARHRPRYADSVKWPQRARRRNFRSTRFPQRPRHLRHGRERGDDRGPGRRPDRFHLQLVQLGVAFAAARAVEPVAALAESVRISCRRRNFAINILAADQLHIARRFAQPLADKFDGVRYSPGAGGIPLIEGAAAQLQCRNETRYYSGDHVIFIGHVLHYAWRDCAPLIFWRGRYTGGRTADGI